MKMVLRILLLVAGFAFGAMPMHGIAATALSVPSPGMAMASDVTVPHHHDGATTSHPDIPCPHATMPADGDHPGHKTMAGGHCGACLTLAPKILFVEMGPVPGSDQAPGLVLRLESTPAAPLERPPRILG